MNRSAGEYLPGGVSSDIRIVETAQGRYVVKQALEKLKVKADWHADPARSSIEVEALRIIADLLGPAHAPHVLWVDPAAHRFAMELIAPRYRNWKQELLRGHVDRATARAAGRLLGQLHVRSSGSAAIARSFANVDPFNELRIRPFFERVAAKNPDLADGIASTVSGIRQHRCALVHGDYSPKNLMVDGGDVVILDCEVAHWGDPRFDLAFCLTHLLLKSFRRGALTHALTSAALGFLSAYCETGMQVVDEHLTRQTACLLLARLEGDSPADYLSDLDTSRVKQFARELLLSPAPDIGRRLGAVDDRFI